MGIAQGGPGASEDTTDLFSNMEFETELFDFTITGLSLSGEDGGGSGFNLNRHGGGQSLFRYNFDDCVSDPDDCSFTDALVRSGDVLFIPGFVEAEIDDFGQGDIYSFDASPRLAFLPLVDNDTVQTLVFSEFSINEIFDVSDVDGDGSADPDLNDDEYESSLEPEPGVQQRTAYGLFDIALRKPAQQFAQADMAGSYGYVSMITSANGNGSGQFNADVEAVRAELTVDASGAVSGSFVGGQEISSSGTGTVSSGPAAPETLVSGSTLVPDVGAGEVTLTLAFGPSDTLELEGAMSANGEMGAFSFFESSPDASGDVNFGEVEFGILLERETSVPAVANTELRLTMIGREFGDGFDSINMLVQNIKLAIGTAFTADCGTTLHASQQCFNATLSGVDGHSFQEGRQGRAGPANESFGELAADGSQSDGDFVVGQAFTNSAVVKVSPDGQVILEIFDDHDDNPSTAEIVEDSFRGYVGVNGAIAIVGGSSGASYANQFIGVGVPVTDATTKTALDNEAPVITGVTASATFPVPPGSAVTLTASATNDDAASLTYKWAARSGSFSQTDAASVSWTAPGNNTGETLLEVQVSDGLSTSVQLVPVSWGLAPPTDNQEEAALVVMDESLESPEDTIDWLLYVLPDSDELPTCENTAGTVTRTFTNNSGTQDEFDPGVGDVVSVTFNNCVESYHSFDNSFFGVNAGEFRMTITEASQTAFEWDVDVLDLEFVDGFCNGSADTCTAEEKEIDNGEYTVEQSLATLFDDTAPQGTVEQIDTFIQFTSYSSQEQEEDGAGGFEDTATFALKSPASAFVFITEYVDTNDDSLAYRLDLDFGYTGTAEGASQPSIDIDVETGDDGLVQGVDSFFNFQHVDGELTISVNALSFADLAEGWTVTVDAIGSTSTDDSQQEYDVSVDTDDVDELPNFGFSATQEDVWDSDECNITPPSADADCDE